MNHDIKVTVATATLAEIAAEIGLAAADYTHESKSTDVLGSICSQYTRLNTMRVNRATKIPYLKQIVTKY